MYQIPESALFPCPIPWKVLTFGDIVTWKVLTLLGLYPESKHFRGMVCTWKVISQTEILQQNCDKTAAFSQIFHKVQQSFSMFIYWKVLTFRDMTLRKLSLFRVSTPGRVLRCKKWNKLIWTLVKYEKHYFNKKFDHGRLLLPIVFKKIVLEYWVI